MMTSCSSWIATLREPLGGDTTTSGPFTFPLSLDNLSLLYRHARLAKLLDLSIPELFVLLRLSPDIPGNRVDSLATLQELIDIRAWQRESGHSIRELANILRDPYGAAADSEVTPQAIAEQAIDRIFEEQSLVFTDTAFAYFEGISEEQSQAIVRANSASISLADLRTYRIASAVVESPGTANIEIPDALGQAPQNELRNIIQDVIATHSLPNAPDISDRVFVGSVGLNLASSRAILAANPSYFRAPKSSRSNLASRSGYFRLYKSICSTTPLLAIARFRSSRLSDNPGGDSATGGNWLATI